jgi:murein DD-endopeptidase MepM/ murein hydrolase activator NlpD
MYSHLATIAPGVRQGTPVTDSMRIGTVGSAGNAVTPHVHLEIHVREQPSSPPVFWLTPYGFFEELQTNVHSAPP